MLLNAHDNYDFRGDLDRGRAIKSGSWFVFSIFAGIGKMFFSVLEAAQIGIGVWIIKIVNIKTSLPIEMNVNIGDLFVG